MKNKRCKMQCCLCKAVFNNDYKASHERSIHGGKKVHIQTVGAPDNPFVASLAPKKRKNEYQNAGNDVEVDDEIKSSKHKKLNQIIIETSTSTCGISIEEETASSYKKFEEDASLEFQDKDAKGEKQSYIVVQEQAEEFTELNSKLDCLSQFSGRKEKDDKNITNLGTTKVSSEATNWSSLMGNLGVLINNLKECSETYKKYCKEEFVNEKFAAIEIMNVTSSVVEMSKNVLEIGNSFIRKLDTKAQNFIIDKADESALISHDPGLRPHTITGNQKSYLLQLGPHQPKLASFPSDGKNRFNPQWYKEFEHLEYSTWKNAAFCFVCSLFPEAIGKKGKTEDAWINVGVRSWSKMKSYGKDKLGKLCAHFTSKSHKVALSEYCHFLMKKGHIDHLIDKSVRLALIEEQKIEVQNRKIIEILIDTCKTLGCQGLAFRESDCAHQGNFVAIVDLISRHNPTLKAWIEDRALRPYKVTYMSPSSQNEIISLIATELKSQIIDEINSSNFFSVMADTTPDMSHKDIMSIVVRTASENGEIRERLLKSVECTDKTGKGMAELILSSLHKDGIDTSKMAFQSYDYASSMSGLFKGVQKYITEEVGHNVPYIPCQDHRTNTALEHACNVNTLIRELFNVLEQLHVFFTSSTKRFSQLKEKLEDIDSAIQLVNLSRTRWTARAKSVKALNNCLEEVIDLLQRISNNKILDTSTKTKAMGLLKKVTTFDFIVTLFFMKNIIEKIKILTEILESPNFNVIDSINVIEITAKNLQNICNNADAMNDLVESAAIFSRKLHIDAENDYRRHHRLSALEMKAFYRREFKEVLDSLAMGLTENSAALKEIFAPITKIFSFPLNKDNLSIETLTKAIKLFPPGYKDQIPDVHVLKSQMEILLDICIEEGYEDFKSSSTPAKTLQDILHHAVKLKDILKQAHKLCIFVITAAYGVASNERSFSQLKIVKSHLRTTMSDERLDSLMLLKCEEELCKGIKHENFVKGWVQLKKRHIKIKQ